MKKTLLAALVVMCMVLVSSASANLLVNPGFEDDVDSNGRPDGWTLDGVSYGGGSSWRTYIQDDAAGANSGDDYMDIGVMGGTGGYSQVYQDIAATAGVEYTFSAYAASAEIVAGETVDFKLVFEFYDASGTRISVTRLTQTIDMDGLYYLQSESMIAPEETVTFRACVVTPNGNNILLDDVSVIPEPATLALLGAGAFLSLRKKKRLS